ncbi:MAG: hypothetical protein AAF799_10735 [Myxococcota bacterium]
MASMTTMRKVCGGLLFSVPLAVGCGDDGGGTGGVNNLGDSSTGTDESATSAATTEQATTASSADETAGTGELMFPATYRFDCMDILAMGDSNGDGLPDAEAIQATLLENTWGSDITNFKLNVLLTVRERDDEAGTATIAIGSGVGTMPNDQCVEGTTASPDYAATFDPDATMWQPSGASDQCVEAGSGTSGGTYGLELGPDDVVYIYAEDDDGTAFNCVPGGAAPSAVPLHAIRATVTVDEAGQIAGGEMTGCLVESEARNLCSCLGACGGAAHPDCGGCPDGGVPLAELLGSVGPTDDCTERMGETAFDFTAGFTTQLLTEVPNSCG